MINECYEPQCKLCGDVYDFARFDIGYAICLPCGNDIAKQVKHTIVPMHKSNLVVVTDYSLLKGLNKYANN